jgi:membrane-associated phospholipid phosphatase
MMTLRLNDLTLLDLAVLSLSLIFASLLLLDPFMLERANTLPTGVQAFFRLVTDIGRVNWMLVPAGAALALALVLRLRDRGFRSDAGYGLMAGLFGFVFVSIGGTSLIANLGKGIIGRARPFLFDTDGALEFKLFAFSPEYASMPSGHAANIFAFATVIAILWPRARVPLYTLAVWIAASRVLVGVHYATDVVLGAILGTAFPYFVRDRFAARRWLFERTPEGGYRLRGARVQRWLGWPKPHRREARQDASAFVTSTNSSQMAGE